VTKMLPGTLPGSAVGGGGSARSKRVRTLDRRVLNLTTAGHLTGDTLAAVLDAQQAVIRRQLEQQAAAQAAAAARAEREAQRG